MLKKKARSEDTIQSTIQAVLPEFKEAPLDNLIVKILSLRLSDEEPKHFAIKVTYFDQLIMSTVIKSIGAKEKTQVKTVAKGIMNYDPSDYEKMCLFADCPLVVNIQPLKGVDLNQLGQTDKSQQTENQSVSSRSNSFVKQSVDISCCNVDILHIFQSDEENPKLCIKKRMEPQIKPTALQCKSWDCLPLLTMEVSGIRHKDNVDHHKVLKEANWMKLTIVGAYNMIIPFDNDLVYTAASKTPLYSEFHTGLAIYNQGSGVPKGFNHTGFYPKWECLRVGEDLFTIGDEKCVCKLEDICNNENIDLKRYMVQLPQYNNVIWGSFHRSLLLKSSESWLLKYIQEFKWPLEVHIYAEDGGFSFMAFLDLFRLLYPGEHTVRLAVPLRWISVTGMMDACNCQLLLTPNDKVPSSIGTAQRPSRVLTESSLSTASGPPQNTGGDENEAFVVVEVKLAKPLKNAVIPPHIPKDKIDDMLKELEETGIVKRRCTGRGQLAKDWQSTIRAAATSLRRVPYYGMAEFCTFNRQMSETRTRVELITSCWQDAAIYVNNNFVTQQYLHSDEVFQEMVMMAHACLMRLARDTLLGGDHPYRDSDPVQRAARQARQMQDTDHAMELYMQIIVNKPRDANAWRELSTCLKDIDKDWARACLNKAMVLDPRHPLTLVSKGGMVFEEDPGAAEKFFVALLAYYPFWTTAWIISSAYYYEREHFLISDKILDLVKKGRREGLTEEMGYARSWERELGDWWDRTPLLPGMPPFYDAADLLLRLRCVALAEVCMARALTTSGETAAYFHLVALCCRLRGEYKEALCHLQTALNKYGEISYLRSLEAECNHQINDTAACVLSYEKAGHCGGPFTTLRSLPVYKEAQRIRAVLVDLVRRQPSAYAWMALANDWMTKVGLTGGADGDPHKTEEESTAKTCAVACAIQALKWDRSAGSAWALLANIVKPSARRRHCLKMASLCGYKITKDRSETDSESQQSLCYRLGTETTDCRCTTCEHVQL